MIVCTAKEVTIGTAIRAYTTKTTLPAGVSVLQLGSKCSAQVAYWERSHQSLKSIQYVRKSEADEPIVNVKTMTAYKALPYVHDSKLEKIAAPESQKAIKDIALHMRSYNCDHLS